MLVLLGLAGMVEGCV
jgi:hypothetical protein